MKLTVKPTPFLKGNIRLPGSKSYSIRAFIVAACGGRSMIRQPSDGEDALVALRVAKMLGARVTKSGRRYTLRASRRARNLTRIDVNESGTALRFIVPLAALHTNHVVISGRGTLRGRPNMYLTRTLRQMGLKIKGQGPKDSIPLRISGGTLKGGKISIDGSLSSQFISALLITCPQLKEDSHLIITGRHLVSLDYIRMTHHVLRAAGVNIQPVGLRQFKIKGAQSFKGLKDFTVPSDLGLAAYYLAAGALVDSKLVLTGHLPPEFDQADGRIIAFLRKMGARFTLTRKSMVIKGPFQLTGGSFSLKDCPDLVPIMAVLALFASGRTRLTDIAHARAKESNRISDLRQELHKIGARVNERADELIIIPQKSYRSHVALDPHHDHRLAMAFAILGLKIGTRIKDVECTRKSYPDFIKDLKAAGANATTT